MRMVCFIISLILTHSVLAATTDGNLAVGNSSAIASSGSFDINVTKRNAVQLSNLNTLVIEASMNGVQDKTSSSNVCYYATTSQYAIDMNSVHDFALTNDSQPNQTMAYKLYWDDGKDNSIDAIFTSNADSIKSFESNNQLSSDCQTTGGSNASITVFIEHQNFNNVAAGLYTDTVTFLLKAQ